MRIVITKKMVDEAVEIRKAAAKRWGCEEKEIIWPLCVGMAMRGESIMMEEIFNVEIVEVQKQIGVFRVEITPSDRPLGEIYNVSVNGKAARIVVDGEKKLLYYDTPIVIGGKRFAAMSLEETHYQKVLAQIDRVREFIIHSANQTKVEIYTITNNSTYGYTVRTDNGKNMRSDVTEMLDLLKGQGCDKEIDAAIKDASMNTENVLGDYECLAKYEVNAENFAKLLTQVREIVAKKNAEAERKESERIAKRNAEINAMSDADFVKKYMTQSIQMNEEGAFAEDIADTVIEKLVWLKTTPEDVRQDSSYLKVDGRNNKTYTYRIVSPESITLLLKRHANLVTARKNEILAAK